MPGGLRERRQRPHHDDRRRPRHPDPVRRAPRSSQLIGAGASGAGGVTYAQNAAVSRRRHGAAPWRPSRDHHADRPGAAFTPAFVGRQIVVGSTIGDDRRPDGHDPRSWRRSSPARRPTTRRTSWRTSSSAPCTCCSAMTPATLQETLAMAQASLGNGSTIDFGLVEGRRRRPAAPRPDLEARRTACPSRSASSSATARQLGGAERRWRAELEASGTVKLRLLPAAHRGRHARARSRTPWSTRPVRGRLRRRRSTPTTPTSVPASARSASTSAPTDDPGSFHAGFGVKATGAADEDTPSIADFFTSGFDVDVDQRRRRLRRGDQILCAEFPVYVSGVTATARATSR